MTRAVLLTKQVPWPSDSGGRIRERHVAELFARQFDEVHVLAFGAAPAEPPPGVVVHAVPRPALLPGLLRSRSAAVARWYSPELERRVSDLLDDDAHLHVGFPHLAVNAPSLRRIDSLDFHNVESSLFAQRAWRDPRRVLRVPLALEARRLAAWERGLAGVPVITCVSENDRVRLRQMGVEASVAPNGAEVPTRTIGLPEQERVVFVGALDWAPNVEGALWLARVVWPLLQQRRPAASAAVVGRSPAPALLDLRVGGVEVAGDVPSVAPWYAGSRLAVCPLLTGGGSRLKILEALAHGRPVVSTRLGAEGLEALVGEGVVLADAPEHFAEAVAGLLADPGRCEELGARGRAAVKARWSWPATLRPLEQAVSGAARSGARRDPAPPVPLAPRSLTPGL